ncbi:hypothetical protein MAPG_10643 [Magnaporthiopsis poae ATCC 64411]|uniref:HNH nuclease domain-containing protein n=1 Tax=Magnaporthiopsis poae (strain ATCC 64411 / 73-15) TaxID=644358 RepID=A0A0C4ED50_MAGP6|nr:hypothetical protein MAPG_10643 [Magnaporthiopsis poae ATCC 64411]
MELPPMFSPPGDSAVPPVDFSTSPVRFRHPAYRDLDSTLLELDAFDKDKDGNYGLDYDVAFVSCGIVANNAFTSGWLATRTAGGFAPVPRPADNLLRGREYFFCVGDADPSTNKYDVIPSFDHWRFPHTLPSPWNRLQIGSADADAAVIYDSITEVKVRDKTCRISGYGNGLETAHVIPVADGNWFHDNDMQRYCRKSTAPQPIMDARNMLLLRADLHSLFNARRFALVAKSVSDPAAATLPEPSAAVCLVLHVMAHNYSNELVHLYHNRPPQPIRGLAPEFLFARYAWSLFADELYPFFRGNSRYNVLLFNRDTSELEQDSLPRQAVHERMRMYPTYSAKGSKSPKKRPREQGSEDQIGAYDDDTASGDDGSSSDEEDTRPPRGSRPLTAVEIDAAQRRRSRYGDTAESSDEERRGRTMKRRFEETDDEASPPPEARAQVADRVEEDSWKKRRLVGA